MATEPDPGGVILPRSILDTDLYKVYGMVPWDVPQ